jgi:transposase-like protein
MPALRKYDEETRARAVRMYRDRLADHGESMIEARRQVGALLDINPSTLRSWVERDEVDRGDRDGVTSAEAAEIRRLRKENAELRRANEILKTASAFFAAAELDRRLT